MKKIILISAIGISSLLTHNSLQANSMEEDVGVISGMVTGGLVAGPIGLVVGAVTGGLLGQQVNNTNSLEATQLELAQLKQQAQQLSQQLDHNKKQYQQQINQLKSWNSQGLVASLSFKTNSAELNQVDQAIIKQLSKLLLQYPNIKLQLDGYTDPRGDESSNYQLSMLRLEAVQKQLAKYQIQQQRIQLIAHGEGQSKGSTGDNDQYALERLVTITIIDQDEKNIAQN